MTLALGLRTVLVVLGALAAADAAQNRGAITGAAWDLLGGELPGATITASSERDRRSVVVGAEGRFRLGNLAPATYRVEASLAAFQTAIAETVVVGSERDTECNFALRVRTSALVTHTLLDAGLTDVLKAADAVVRLRIAHVIGPSVLRSPQPHVRYVSTEQSGVVVSVLKNPPAGLPPAGAFHFRQVQAGGWGSDGRAYGGAEPAYRVGDELIGFFARDSEGQLTELEGGYFMFRVVRESVLWPRAPSHGIQNGMSVDAFLEFLRKSLPARHPTSQRPRVD